MIFLLWKFADCYCILHVLIINVTKNIRQNDLNVISQHRPSPISYGFAPMSPKFKERAGIKRDLLVTLVIVLWSPTGYKTSSRSCLTIRPRHALTFCQKHPAYAQFSESGFTIVCFYGILVLARCECLTESKVSAFITAVLNEETMREWFDQNLTPSQWISTHNQGRGHWQKLDNASTFLVKLQNHETLSKAKCEKCQEI